jgi:hypothetical protein
VVDASDIVFLTVPDDAITAVCVALRWRAGKAAVHCAGATDLSVLQAAADAGAAIGGFHPLVMFADPEIAARSIAGAAIGIEAEEPLASALRRMVRTLGARELVIPPGGRAAYHGAAHFAAGFAGALVAEGVAPDAILTSPLLRARETADALGFGRSESDDRLAPGATVDDVRAAVAGRGETVLVVGHQPDCSEITLALTGEECAFAPASFAAIELP